MTVARLGYEIDSSGAVKAAFDLNAMAKASGTAEAASSRLERELNKTMRTSNGAASGVLSLDVALGSTTKAISTTTSAATIFEAQVSGIGNEIARTAAESQIWQRELEQTRARFDPLFAASKRYEQELRDIAEAERMGAINANVAAQARDRAATAMNGGAVAATKFGGAMKVSTMHTANLGAQLNDIGVMLAAGQSPLQLAVQQGTQINQVFAQMGGGRQALRGLAAGFMSMVNPMSLATIGIIAGGAALVQWGMSAFGASEEAKEFADALKEIEQGAIDAERELAVMRQGLNSVQELLVVEQINKLNEQRARIEERILSLRGRNKRAAELGLATLDAEIAGLNEKLDRIRSGNNALDEQKYLIESANMFLEAQQRIRNENGDAMRRQLAIEKSLTDELGAGAVEALKVAGVDLSNIDDAARRAASLAASMGIAYGEAYALANVTFPPIGGGLTPDMDLLPPSGDEPSRRGGGGSRVDQFARDLERLRESLRTEQEVVTEWYSEQQAILDNRRALEILGIEGHNEAKLRLEQEYQERLAGISQAGLGGNLGVMSEFFGEAAGLMQAGNAKLFKIGQAAAIANALINARSAAVAAWDKGMQAGGPPVAAAFAALSVAKTAAEISAIKSASFSGGAGSGTSASAGVSATSSGGQSTQPQRAIVQLTGSMAEVVAPMMDEIVSQLQSQSDDGVIIEGFTRA